MKSKALFSSSLPVIRNIGQDKSVATDASNPTGWSTLLKKIWFYLRPGNNEKTDTSDPTAAIIAQVEAAIIAQIEDKGVAGIVRELHYRTPKSLQAMRNACESCFVLPDDCPYYDYSIFDVKKAFRKLADQPRHIQTQVVWELQKINQELAGHLADCLE
jgi:hypothetical protein